MTDRGALYWHKIDLSTSTQLPDLRIISLTQVTVWFYECYENTKQSQIWKHELEIITISWKRLDMISSSKKICSSFSQLCITSLHNFCRLYEINSMEELKLLKEISLTILLLLLQ